MSLTDAWFAGTDVSLPDREAVGHALLVLASTAVTLALLFGLWPPGAVYWTAVAAVLGEAPTLFAVALLAVGLGAWFGRTTAIPPAHLLAGALLAYAVGMLAIEWLLAPDSPAHLVLYALLLGGLLAGAALWWSARRFAAASRSDRAP